MVDVDGLRSMRKLGYLSCSLHVAKHSTSWLQSNSVETSTMEFLRPSSPDLNSYKLSARRHTLQVQTREDLLTSSLPSSTLQSAFSALRKPTETEDTFVGSIGE